MAGDEDGDIEYGTVRRGGDRAEPAPQPGLDRLGPLVDRISFAASARRRTDLRWLPAREREEEQA
ncbi:hypothetical protein PV726_18395 [Streptomyces europaeiscabiei]|uniref:hypothetical protein n=1 Tax=Streptomyces europaeiscabiei TaxID=146819 RepID=UPI0029A7795E|nr:hypothetical protein [Streptomyces europaeiscabiei]MDX3692282.1 hypothetical protein [Streptomyces europaeiscabiei]